jgi:hypothetical protein
MPLRVLVACECSGRVRDAFAALHPDWEVWSADTLPSEIKPVRTYYPDPGRWHHFGIAGRGWHYQGDVRDLFRWYHPVNASRNEERLSHAHWEPPLWDLIIAHPPCFTAGTPVITARGVVPIEAITKGDRVLTHKGRWRAVTKTMSREAAVITDGQVTATPDHPFWAREKEPRRYGPSTTTGGGNPLPFELGLPKWLNAEKTQGKYLALPVTAEPLTVPELHGVTQTAAFWYMVGRWVGDGWTRIQDNVKHPHYDTTICCAREEAPELAESLLETSLPWNSSEERTVTRFTLSHKYLCRWLEANFGKFARGKTLPGWLFGAPESVRRELLRGYLDADGSRSATGSSGLISHASTISKPLAIGVRVLATTLGYTTTLTKNFRAGPALIEGRIVTQQDSWSVIIRKDDGRFTRLDSSHRWTKQRRTWEDAGTQTVYDITVEEDHSFTAHGFVVHNCTDLSYAGARWFKAKQADGRQRAALGFFGEMVNSPSPLVAVENPHSLAQKHYGRPTQIVQPWMFGDPFTKGIHLWLKGLPPLVPVDPVDPVATAVSGDVNGYRGVLRAATGGGSWRTDKRAAEIAGVDFKGASHYEDSEGRVNRAKVRSRTFPGVARAFAAQWGDFAEEYYRELR